MKATIFLALLGLAAAGSFDESITKHFVPADEAKAKAAEAKKPLLVLITEEWCGACNNLKTQLNGGEKVKGKLDQFVVTHVSGDDSTSWKEEGHGYVPQTYFFNADGSPMDVKGPMDEYAHFFGGEDALAEAMDKAIALGTGKEEL
eukprot:g625.t1